MANSERVDQARGPITEVQQTNLPQPKYIKVESVGMYDGSPAKLESFDISICNADVGR